MYLPIVFGFEVYNEIPIFIGFFYKFVEQALKYNWTIISQEKYFEDPIIIEKKYNYSIEKCLEIHEVSSMNKEILNKVKKYIIPEEIGNEIINMSGSIDNAWINLMNKEYEALKQYLKATIKTILNKNEIKAILVWRHNESISAVAKELNISVIEMEFSTIRKNYYNENISYFQFSNKFSNKEFTKRLNNYKKGKKFKYILTRKEILALFLKKDYLNYIVKLEQPEIYDYGVALGLKKDFEAKSMNCMENIDTINFSLNMSNKKNILFRPHPSSESQLPKDINIDSSENSIEFILKCRRIISCLSNISFEAMLYGKTSYVLGTMPYDVVAIKNSVEEESVVSLDILNYILFGFYAPYSIMLEKEYLDFRMENPSEFEIYKKHFEYYIEKKCISKKVLNLNGTKRFSKILEGLNYYNILKQIKIGKNDFYQENIDNLKKIQICEEKNYILKRELHNIKSYNEKLQNELKNIKNRNEILKQQMSETELELNNCHETISKILNSKSWKITAPFRKLKISKKS